MQERQTVFSEKSVKSLVAPENTIGLIFLRIIESFPQKFQRVLAGQPHSAAQLDGKNDAAQ